MSITNRIFKDADGNVVIIQFPNIPLLTYILCLFVSKLTDGILNQFFETLGFGALFVFAWLEFFQGVNYFRRALGLIVLIFTIKSKIG